METIFFGGADINSPGGFGGPGSIPVVGNWDGLDAADEVGVFVPETGEWLLDENGDGVAETTIPSLGGSTIPVVGDWNGDGTDKIGTFSPSTGTWRLDKNGDRIFDTSNGDVELVGFGGHGSIPVTGDWNGDGADGIGTVTPLASNGLFQTATITATSNDQLNQGAGFDPKVKLTCDDDEDLDGICDEWVVGGEGPIQFTVSGTTHTRNCSPLLVDNDPDASTKYTGGLTVGDVCPKNDRKQMFYELDYMTGHKPVQSAIEPVIQAFLDAPVNNIDGSTGIDLFITVDEDYGFHKILVPINGTAANPGFDQFKVNFFGTAAQRAGPSAAADLTGTFQYYRYMSFIHQLTYNPPTSGWGEIGGNDVVISLGAFAGNVGSTGQQTGTILHEIGHNIFLDHGGVDGLNCKPNYLSVMNYLFQFDVLIKDRPLDFSHQRLDNLVETNLDENVGVTLSVHPTAGILNTTVGVENPAGGSTTLFAETGRSINYSLAGDATDSGVLANINFFDSIDACQLHDQTTLEGHNDWANVKLPFRDEAAFADGMHSVPNELDIGNLTNIIQSVQSERIVALVSIVNELGEEDFEPPGIPAIITSTDPPSVLVKLGQADNALKTNSGDSDFEAARSLLMQVRDIIAELSFSEEGKVQRNLLLSQIDVVTNVFDFMLNVSEESDHDSPIANSQVVIINNLDPFEITLSGADPNTDPLTFSIADDPDFGTLSSVTWMAPTSAVVTYTPGSSFVKTDSFTFKVNDGTIDSYQATVSIVLNQAPIAEPQNVILKEGTTSLDITLTGQDTDNDELTFLTQYPSFGILSEVTSSLDGRSATVKYTPSAGFDGRDIFRFKVNDGMQNSEEAIVKITVAGKSVDIFNKHPPMDDKKTDKSKKPTIEIDRNESIHILIDGRTIDVTTIDPTSVFFGPIGDEFSGTRGIHVFDENFGEKHIKDFDSDDGALVNDKIPDIELQFKMSELNIDPALNDENGEQTLCLSGFALSPESENVFPIQFHGCIVLTVGGNITVEPEEQLHSKSIELFKLP